MTGTDEDPDARRYGPIIIFCLVLTITLWSRGLYELGN